MFTHKDNKGCLIVTNERRYRAIKNGNLIVDSLYSRVSNNSSLTNLISNTLYDEILLTAWNDDGFIINSGGNIDVRSQLTVNQFETVRLKLVSDKWLVISKNLY